MPANPTLTPTCACCCLVTVTPATCIVPAPPLPPQDVELQSNCCLTCFGLQAVNVQTAGQGGAIAPEVSAAFLRQPDKVREAIRLAVKLNKQQGQREGGYAAPRQQPLAAWDAVTPAQGANKGSGSLMQRLQHMDGVVARGVLTRAEADGLKVRPAGAGSRHKGHPMVLVNSRAASRIGFIESTCGSAAALARMSAACV